MLAIRVIVVVVERVRALKTIRNFILGEKPAKQPAASAMVESSLTPPQ
jgi:hypothetical protein